jgi:hypothetical protein
MLACLWAFCQPPGNRESGVMPKHGIETEFGNQRVDCLLAVFTADFGEDQFDRIAVVTTAAVNPGLEQSAGLVERYVKGLPGAGKEKTGTGRRRCPSGTLQRELLQFLLHADVLQANVLRHAVFVRRVVFALD